MFKVCIPQKLHSYLKILYMTTPFQYHPALIKAIKGCS